MVSSRSKSPSASNIESLLPQDTEWSQTTLRQAGSTSPKKNPAGATRHSLLTQNAHTHSRRPAHMFKGLVDSHSWVYAVGVRVIDRCWRGAVIHIGWVPTCWVWIGCSKPVHRHTQTHTHTHTHTHIWTQDKSLWVYVQQLPKQLPSACFAGLTASLWPFSVLRVNQPWRQAGSGAC